MINVASFHLHSFHFLTFFRFFRFLLNLVILRLFLCILGVIRLLGIRSLFPAGLFPGLAGFQDVRSMYPQTIRWTFGMQLKF